VLPPSSRYSSVAMMEYGVLLRLRCLTAKLHGVTADKSVMFIVNVVRASIATTSNGILVVCLCITTQSGFSVLFPQL
jgi:hypothetical protein